MRRGMTFLLRGNSTELSKCLNGPLAYATMYDDMGGVVSKCVTFHLSSEGRLVNNLSRSFKPVSFTALGSITFSEIAGMLLKLTVLSREIKVTAKVALRRGSSQEGNALLADVGYFPIQYGSLVDPLKSIHLELSQCIILCISIFLP